MEISRRSGRLENNLHSFYVLTYLFIDFMECEEERKNNYKWINIIREHYTHSIFPVYLINVPCFLYL